MISIHFLLFEFCDPYLIILWPFVVVSLRCLYILFYFSFIHFLLVSQGIVINIGTKLGAASRVLIENLSTGH